MNFSAATLTQVGLGVFLFTLIVLILAAVILAARSRLVAEGSVTVMINGERELQIPVGVKLMNGLADAGIFLVLLTNSLDVDLRRRWHLWPVLLPGPVRRRRHPAHGNLVDQSARGEGALPTILPGRRQAGHGDPDS